MTILFLYYPPLLLISFIISFLFPTMMTFCKKSVHSFLGLTPSFDRHTTENNLAFKCHNPQPFCTAGDLGLVINAATGDDDIHKPKPENNINVLESATVNISSCSPPSLPSSPMVAKRDPGGIGFIDDIGGGVDGLMSCTESLGFESSDERRVDDWINDIQMSTSARDDCDQEFYCWKKSRSGEARARWKKVGREAKRFPPPLSSLNINGQPSFFLRPVRKDGRLQLTEVRIQRKEILRASRQDGRLRLHLVRDEDAQDFLYSEEEEEEEVQEELKITEQEKEEQQEIIEQDKKEQEIEQEKEERKKQGEEVEEAKGVEEQGQEEEVVGVEVEEEATRVGEWKFPVSSGEGFSRCYELVNHHHHHNQHHQYQNHSNHHHLLLWRQHCLTTG